MSAFNIDEGEMDSAAVAMHEMYMSFTRAGFSETQAMELLKVQIKVLMGVADDGS